MQPQAPVMPFSLPSPKGGKYVALNQQGTCVAQGKNVDAVVEKARRKGCKIPILLNLDITKKRRYIF